MTNSARTHWADLIAIVTIAILALVILGDANPLFSEPGRDGGLFMFIGQQLFKGKTLYTELWDLKGPLIFWINALGFAIGGGTRWEVFLLQWLFMTLGAAMLYFSFCYRWSRTVAITALLCGMAALQLVYGKGNLVEEFSNLFNSIALFLLLNRIYRRPLFFQPLGIGVAIGLAFML